MLSLLLATAYFFSGGVGVPCVLCVEEDGSLALELAGKGCGACCSSSKEDDAGTARPLRGASSERSLATSGEPCPGCVDIPILLAAGSPTTRGTASSGSPTDLGARLAPQPTSPGGRLAASILATSLARGSGTGSFAAQRSPVLRR